MARKSNNNTHSDKRDQKTTPNTNKKGGKNKRQNQAKDELDTMGRNNNPNWYYLDAMVADQVSQISFQQLAGEDLVMNGGVHYPIGDIMVIALNPSPGVENASVVANSAINLAGFRLFSKLSAYTGRTATYGPQDISTMILIFGETISKVEVLRRAFGVAYQMNMRNRAYPKRIVEAMNIDPDDLFKHLADYRTRFNSIITRINQIPIPKNVAYFDKCAALYEKIYLDVPNSAMAQTIFYMPATSWSLDETGYTGGTVLRTEDWYCDKTQRGQRLALKTMGDYLDVLENDVQDLLNSSSLQTVYTDLLNLATKTGVEFWRFDYLATDYIVMPEYNQNFMLQFHNTTFVENPVIETTETYLSAGYTPSNDVYPDASKNILLYNPTFRTAGGINMGIGVVPDFLLLDMLDENVSVEDRIEVTRFTSALGPDRRTPSGQSVNNGIINAALPDHYGVRLFIMKTDGTSASVATLMTYRVTNDMPIIADIGKVDWAPLFYEAASGNVGWSGVIYGDLNFYTIVNYAWLGKLHDFVGLGLYDLR